MPASSKLASSATALFAILCLVSAGLQWNDPDPWAWVAIYLAAAAATVAALVRPSLAWAPAVVALVAVGWGGWLWSRVAGIVEVTDLWRKMSEKGGAVEEMREAGGLTIVAIACGLAAWRARSWR